MQSIRFNYKGITVENKDDLTDAIAKVETVDDAVSLIVKFANSTTQGEVSKKHLRFACGCVSRASSGKSNAISTAIVRLY